MNVAAKFEWQNIWASNWTWGHGEKKWGNSLHFIVAACSLKFGGYFLTKYYLIGPKRLVFKWYLNTRQKTPGFQMVPFKICTGWKVQKFGSRMYSDSDWALLNCSNFFQMGRSNVNEVKLVCSYIHEAFISDPNLAKLTHFQVRLFEKNFRYDFAISDFQVRHFCQAAIMPYLHWGGSGSAGFYCYACSLPLASVVHWDPKREYLKHTQPLYKRCVNIL